MKRTNNLIEKISETDNLYLAFWKASKGKRYSKDVLIYQKNLDENLLNLQYQINEGKVNVGKYKFFTVHDPKERLICAAEFSERVLHHALMNHCHDTFEKKQILDSYASRMGKGTYAAIDRAKQYTKQYKYFLKLDFRKYFDSIDHFILKKQLSKMFKEEKLLLIFHQIVDSYHRDTAIGLPIGNLTSQYFANHYLTLADRFTKEVLKVRAYVRYMDDVILWSNNKEDLLNVKNKYYSYTKEYLKLELKPIVINNCIHGLPFLGYLIYPNKNYLAQKSKKRFIKKFKKYTHYLNRGYWTQKKYQRHILPLFAFLEKADSKGFRRQFLQKINLT